jgi:hypothetical protein
MTQDESFKAWWYSEGSQAPYTHHDCEEHTMRMCEIAWANGAYKEREACADAALKAAESSIVLAMKIEREACADLLEHGYIDDEGHHLQYAKEIRARGQA